MVITSTSKLALEWVDKQHTQHKSMFGRNQLITQGDMITIKSVVRFLDLLYPSIGGYVSCVCLVKICVSHMSLYKLFPDKLTTSLESAHQFILVCTVLDSKTVPGCHYIQRCSEQFFHFLDTLWPCCTLMICAYCNCVERNFLVMRLTLRLRKYKDSKWLSQISHSDSMLCNYRWDTLVGILMMSQINRKCTYKWVDCSKHNSTGIKGVKTKYAH